MQEEPIAERSSPAGRPIRVRTAARTPPTWVARRRRAYALIDGVAEGAMYVVRRWLLPRPPNAGRNAA
ncbi:MAG: hypothetical protein JO020_11390 [Chloroflexi bacterium]|nr:hypothetical protein [Chloroflexota bacterium]MBV9894764.1 hypothetical protein [Chloroflexota bacterium]